MARVKKAAAAAINPTEGAAAPSETPVIDAAAAAIVTGTETEEAATEVLTQSVGAVEPVSEVSAAPSAETEEAVASDMPVLNAIVARAAEFEKSPAGEKIWPDRLGHDPLMTLHLDGEEYQPGDLVFVTRGEFVQLRGAKVFAGEWEDGFEGLDDGDD